MKTNATITGPNGKVTLVFGIYGLKNFCKRLGCEPTVGSILPALQGGTRLEAISEIIRSGMEQAAAESGETVFVSDFEACDVLESAKGDEAEAVIKAFLSSIVGEDYDTWYKRVTKQNKAAETADTDEATSEKKSTQAGTKSKPKLTES